MNTQILSVRPDGPLFDKAVITVVRIDPDEFVQDYDQSAVDLALVEFQTEMLSEDEQDLSMIREYLDMFSEARFWQIGLRPARLRKKQGTFSDFALAVLMLHQHSPYGIQYTFPRGHTIVYYRGHVYERTGDTLRLLKDDDQ